MRQPLFSARLDSEPSSAAYPPLSYRRGHSWARAGGNACPSSPPLRSLLLQHPMFLADCTGGLPPSLSPLPLPRARVALWDWPQPPYFPVTVPAPHTYMAYAGLSWLGIVLARSHGTLCFPSVPGAALSACLDSGLFPITAYPQKGDTLQPGPPGTRIPLYSFSCSTVVQV